MGCKALRRASEGKRTQFAESSIIHISTAFRAACGNLEDAACWGEWHERALENPAILGPATRARPALAQMPAGRSPEEIYRVFPWVKDAVERVTGEREVDPLLARGDTRLVAAIGLYEPPRRPSRRQCEIMRLVLEGLPEPQIAEILGISRWTVMQHTREIREKFGVRATFQAAVAAGLLGWLPD